MSAEMAAIPMTIAAPVMAAPGAAEAGAMAMSSAVAPAIGMAESAVHLPGFVNMVGEVAPTITDFHIPSPSGKDIFAGLSAYNPSMDEMQITDTSSPVLASSASQSLEVAQARADVWSTYMALYAQPVGKSEAGVTTASQVADAVNLSLPQPSNIPEVPLGVPDSFPVSSPEVSMQGKVQEVELTPEITLAEPQANAILQEVTPTIFDPAPMGTASDEAVAARAVALLEELGMEESIPEVDVLLAERKNEAAGTMAKTAVEEAEEVVKRVVQPQPERKTTAPAGRDEEAADQKPSEENAELPEEDATMPPPPKEPENPEEPDREPDPTPRPTRREPLYIHDDPVNGYRAQLLGAIAHTEWKTNEGPHKLIQGVRMRDEFVRLASSDPNAKSGILDEGEHDQTIDFVGNVFAQQGLLTEQEIETKATLAVVSHTAVDKGNQGTAATEEEVRKVAGTRRYASMYQSPYLNDAGAA